MNVNRLRPQLWGGLIPAQKSRSDSTALRSFVAEGEFPSHGTCVSIASKAPKECTIIQPIDLAGLLLAEVVDHDPRGSGLFSFPSSRFVSYSDYSPHCPLRLLAPLAVMTVRWLRVFFVMEPNQSAHVLCHIESFQYGLKRREDRKNRQGALE